MSQSTIEQRYANALMRISGSDTKNAQKLLAALSLVEDLFKVEDARKVLMSPVMPKDLKLALLNYALAKSGKMEDLEKFVQTVVEAQRTKLLPGIIRAFTDLVNAKLGIVRGEIHTALPLDNNEMQAIADDVKKKLKDCRQVELTQRVDPKLLGGFVLKLGNAVLDLSLKAKLDFVAKAE